MLNYLKSILVISAVFLSCTSFAIGQPSRETEVKQQKKDFTAFKKGLFGIEAKVDRHISMDSIQRFLTAMEQEMTTKVLTPIEEFKWYARCINLVQCGHTQARPSKKVFLQYYFAKKSLPFDVEMVNKHLYVYGYEPEKKSGKGAKNKRSKEDMLPVGTEIVAIDGLTIPQWMSQIGEFIGSDEDDPAFEYVMGGGLFDFYRFLVADPKKTHVNVDYVSKNDTIREKMQLGPVPVKMMSKRFDLEEKKAKKNEHDQGKFKFIGTTAYFRFPSFLACHGRSYSEFLKKSFKKIKKKKGCDMVVIDLRGNLGGVIQPELLGYFLEEQQIVSNYDMVNFLKKRKDRKHIKRNDEFFRKYKKNMRIRRRLKKKRPGYNGEIYSIPVDKSLQFKGQIVVLTDEATFSAAGLLAAQLKTMCNAVIIGSRPGGTFYSGNAGTLTYTLPHSKISFMLNPNVCKSMLDAKAIDPNIKNVDYEIVAEYHPKPSNYKKNFEEVVKIAIREAKKLKKD
jgi:hypothetical protein